jgi:hypothetical protein
MTVCIAALAAHSRAIVCIADRAVTYSSSTGGPSSQADAGAQKIVELGKTGWVALIGGGIPFAQKVTDKLIAVVGTERNPARQRMQTVAKQAFTECLNEEIIDQVLTPNMLTRDDFFRRPNTLLPLDQAYVLEIAQQISNVEIDSCLIVCGFDAQGPHIFKIDGGARISPCDIEGYAVIGGGEDASRSRIIWSETDRDESLESVMYDVFDAKVSAEIVQGVGYKWDWRILTGKRPRRVPTRISELIDKLWIASNRSPLAEPLGKQERPSKNWKKRLADFSASVLRG